MGILRIATSICTAGLVGLAAASPALADAPVLAAVKKRGELLCGVNGQLPGFSAPNEQKQMSGLEVDLCRAIAAAVFGDGAKARFVEVTVRNRFDLLRAGNVDVLFRNTIPTLERTVNTGVRDAFIYYFDGQAVAVPKRLGVKSLSELQGRPICVLSNTPYGRIIRDWFTYRKLDFKLLSFDDQKQTYDAFFAGKCDGVTQQVSAITTTIVATGHAADYMVLPEILANNPMAAFVRSGDDQWLDVVRWTLNALLEAEERGITQANVDSQLGTGTPETKRLLGTPPDDGKLLGVDRKWAYDAIKQVGNFGEIFERNLGKSSPWRFARGVNANWTAGGVFHSVPIR